MAHGVLKQEMIQGMDAIGAIHGCGWAHKGLQQACRGGAPPATLAGGALRSLISTSRAVLLDLGPVCLFVTGA